MSTTQRFTLISKTEKLDCTSLKYARHFLDAAKKVQEIVVYVRGRGQDIQLRMVASANSVAQPSGPSSAADEAVVGSGHAAAAAAGAAAEAAAEPPGAASADPTKPGVTKGKALDGDVRHSLPAAGGKADKPHLRSQDGSAPSH